MNIITDFIITRAVSEISELLVLHW